MPSSSPAIVPRLERTTFPLVKLGYMIGYWGSGPPAGVPEGLADAERLGFDSCWTAEAYGSDALTPLAWWGAATKSIDRKSTRLNSSHTVIYTLSLHDALPISGRCGAARLRFVLDRGGLRLRRVDTARVVGRGHQEHRSEEHTSELQSHSDLHSFPTRRSSDLWPMRSGSASIRAGPRRPTAPTR